MKNILGKPVKFALPVSAADITLTPGEIDDNRILRGIVKYDGEKIGVWHQSTAWWDKQNPNAPTGDISAETQRADTAGFGGNGCEDTRAETEQQLKEEIAKVINDPPEITYYPCHTGMRLIPRRARRHTGE